jgi:hypothetical protein
MPVGTGAFGRRTHEIRATFLQTVRGEVEDTRGWLTPVFAGTAAVGAASPEAVPAT